MIHYARITWPPLGLAWQTLVRDSYHPCYLGMAEAYLNICSLETKLTEMIDYQDVIAWQATREGELLALLVAEFNDKRLVIYDLFVASACQGLGIGRSLVEFVIIDSEAASVAAEVNTDNNKSLALFEKLGFQPISTSVWLERLIPPD